MKKQVVVMIAVLALLFLGQGCEPSSDQKQQASKGPSVADVANKVVEGVATVQSTFTDGIKGPVYVFEEFHTSRVGQLEIAVMLLRLREQYGVKKVGLEGAIQTPRALNAVWFHHAGGDGAKAAREDVAVRMLGEGEISSPELLALLFPDEEVYGIERADLYNRKHELRESAVLGYLVSIAQQHAQQNLTQTEIKNFNRLVSQGKRDEARELLINSDPWTREQYKPIKASMADNAGATACEVMAQRIRDLQSKAGEQGVSVDAQIKRSAEQTIGFYETCHERSIAMVGRTVELSGTGSSTSTAMIIGGAHTDGVTKLLREQRVSFAVISPTALNATYGSLTLDQFDRKNETKWARTSPGTLGRLLNAAGKTQGSQEGRKPPPMIETTTAKSYASAQLAGMLIATAARGRKRIPDDIWDQIKDLPEFTADRASFTVVGDDVIYKSTLKKTDGKDVIVWARVGTADSVPETKSLEQKLLQARVDLGAIGNIPPTKPPSNSTPTKDEGPGDGKRGTIVISRTGLKSLAVFAANKNDVMKVGKVSG